MRRGLLLATAGVLMLSACQRADEASTPDIAQGTAADVAAFAPPPEAARQAESGTAAEASQTASPPPVSAPPVVAPPVPIARIAYAYRYVLSIPRDRGAEMMSRHELACASAGAGYCQVVSANADWMGRRPSGVLELRGQPEWIDRFRSGLALDARNLGGTLESAVTEGEDVTAGIGRAQSGVATADTLSARIRELQARQGGTMQQRLEIERQLADLLRQRDEQAARLQELETRVLTARLTLDYRQGGAFASDNPTRPVAQALQDAFGLSMGMLAVLITLGSVALPVVAIGGVVWWAAVLRRRKHAAA